MIFATNTPNNTGIAIHGDFKDLGSIYDALHEIVGTRMIFRNFHHRELEYWGVVTTCAMLLWAIGTLSLLTMA